MYSFFSSGMSFAPAQRQMLGGGSWKGRQTKRFHEHIHWKMCGKGTRHKLGFAKFHYRSSPTYTSVVAYSSKRLLRIIRNFIPHTIFAWEKMYSNSFLHYCFITLQNVFLVGHGTVEVSLIHWRCFCTSHVIIAHYYCLSLLWAIESSCYKHHFYTMHLKNFKKS